MAEISGQLDYCEPNDTAVLIERLIFVTINILFYANLSGAFKCIDVGSKRQPCDVDFMAKSM